MSARLFVGNISYNASEEDLKAAFNQLGFQVKKATIVTDRDTGQTRGFGFVDLDDESRARDAMAVVNGTLVAGRPIRVNEAHERERRPQPTTEHRDDRRQRGGKRGEENGRW